jgi:dienelactone hydrolase
LLPRRASSPASRPSRSVCAVVCAGVALSIAGCTTSASSSAAGNRYAERGPHQVGVTTLGLGDAGTLGPRQMTIFYPADASRIAGHSQFTYHLGDPLPAAITAIVPAKYNSTVTVPAYVDAPGSPQGPYPVVLFSHGFSASRLYYSQLLSGIASWGFVVISADYLERGLLAQATQATVKVSPATDQQIMFASFEAAQLSAAAQGSPLHGVMDAGKVAAVGHSAGGQTAFDALDDPRVATAIGWAPVGPAGPVPPKPVMIIGEPGDIALTPATLTREFHQFRGMTTYVEISGSGHNSYTDICPSIRGGGGGLVGFAMSMHLVSQDLAKLATNGCTAKDRTPQSFWPIVQAYTVAALRSGLHLGAPNTRSLPGPDAFAPRTITVRQHS